MTNSSNNADLQWVPDPNTESLLLPSWLVEKNNSRQVRHYKRALRLGMQRCLTPTQREQMQMYYNEGLRKSDIARKQASTCSAVCKSMKVGECALREFIELYMDIFQSLEREFLLNEGLPTSDHCGDG